MDLTPIQWHQRYLQQAEWTAELREYLYTRAGLAHASRVLEVGCGTGAVLAGLSGREPAAFGLDLNPTYLEMAGRHIPSAFLTCGDAHTLPFVDRVFDLVVCHFLLLWVSDPLRVLQEMVRVTLPGGAVLALAEPDYGGRIDHPEALSLLGQWQRAALRSQGADPELGRRLAGLLVATGLRNVETGVLGGRWVHPADAATLEGEWEVMRADLSGKVPEETLQKLYDQDRAANTQGGRVLYVPTFFSWGRVSS